MEVQGEQLTCDVYLQEIPGNLKGLGDKCLEKAGMHIVKFTRHDFQPQGSSLIWVLSESHFTIHTYPEHNYLSIDCYTCKGGGNPQKAILEFLNQCNIKTAEIHKFKRGTIKEKPSKQTPEEHINLKNTRTSNTIYLGHPQKKSSKTG